MKAQDLENIVNAWAVDYTSASAQHNVRAFTWSVSIIKVFLMAKGSLLFLRGLQEKRQDRKSIFFTHSYGTFLFFRLNSLYSKKLLYFLNLFLSVYID